MAASTTVMFIIFILMTNFQPVWNLRYIHTRSCYQRTRLLHKTDIRISTPFPYKTSLQAGKGTVALVGSGPGDPMMLTYQAVSLFQNASLVVADRLISKEILAMIKCELKVANKRPGCAEEAQEEIYQWVKEAIEADRNVVRLKIGDPYLFGRGAEEVIEFRKWGVEPIIAPGISSSYSAPLVANIPLTHRGVANQVLISTGYGKDSTEVDLPEYVADRTVVLLMAVGRIAEIAKKLKEDMHFPSDTPVAIIEKATTPFQRTLLGTLKDIGYIAERDKATAPATIIIGHVVHALD